MSLADSNGEAVVLGPRLGRGGEGEVFEVAGDGSLVAKVLHPGRATAAKQAKVRQMLARPPAGAYDLIEGYPVLTWPRGVLRDGGAFAGYTMARVPAGHFVAFFRLTTNSRRSGLGGPPLTWDRRVLLGMRLCHLVRTLHRFGYAVGDLNDRNVLVSRRLTPLIMDTDSFQVPRHGWGHHPSVVGDALYWPPELLDVDLNRHTASRETGDRFALGVLLFQLFMDGMRPYQARGSLVDGLETVAHKTRAGHYPWHRPRPGVLEPPANAPSYAALPASVRDAFERCFVAGHRKPGRRPTAQDWHDILAKVMAGGFRTCPRRADHVHAARESECPWCQHAVATARPAPRVRPKPMPVAHAATGNAVPVPARLGRHDRAHRPASRQRAPRTPRKPTTGRRAGSSRRAPRQRVARPLPPAPQPASPRRSSPKATRHPPLAAHWAARAAWIAGVLVALATPAAALAETPESPAKRVVSYAVAFAWLGGAGAAAAWRWLGPMRWRLGASWLWAATAASALAGLASAGRWSWLAWLAGAVSSLAAIALFTWRERRDATPFRPDRSGIVSGALAIPVALLPLLAVWAWRAWGT